MAAYTRCLRCAGAPRRPASGSELSLHILSWHAVPCDPGESEHRQFQTAMSAWPSPRINRLRTPKDPAIRFTRGGDFGGTLFAHLLPACQVARPPVRIRPIFRLAPGGFYFQAFNRSVSLPVAGYDYNSDWTSSVGGTLTR